MDRDLHKRLLSAGAKAESFLDLALSAAVRSPWTLFLFAAWTLAWTAFGFWLAR